MKRKDFNIFEQFIPSSDLDGVDAKPEILSWLQNYKIKNGFLQTYPTFSEIPLAENTAQLVANGYEMLDAVSFYHSKQGEVLVIILWKETATLNTKLKIMVNDIDVTGHLYWGGAVTNFIEKPSNINFALVNDELKINLNCEATTTLVTPMILNLTLIYLEEVKYVENNNNMVREPGWYLRPRWLGMTCGNYASPIVFFVNYYGIIPSGNPKFYLEDFQDENYIPEFSFDGLPATYSPAERLLRRPGVYSMGGINGNLVQDVPGIFHVGFRINNLRNLSKISFNYEAKGDLADDMSIEVKVIETDNPASAQTIFKKTYEQGIIRDRDVQVEIPVNKISIKSFYLLFLLDIPPKTRYDEFRTAETCVLAVDNIKLTANEGVIIGKYRNGQRALLTITGDSYEEGTLLGIYGYGNTSYPYRDLTLKLARNRVEYDIVEYEIYFQNPVDNLYYKRLSAKVDGKWEVDPYNPTTLVMRVVDVVEEDKIETLNFNYGLGLIRVDNQFKIFSEAVLSGKIYAVTDSYEIRTTHIAGNGLLQPDSFPYDHDQNFGFIEESKNVKLLAALILNENNLALLSQYGMSIYSVYANRGMLVKLLRVAFQDYTGFNVKSLTKAVTGISPTPGFFFTTTEGIWYHSGEVNALPKNLIAGKLDNLWQSAKKDGIGLYVPATKEYWYQYKDTEFLVYEVLYETFRIQTAFANNISFAFLQNKDIVVGTKNKLGVWKMSNPSYDIAGFSTHNFELNSPYYNKILHSLEISLKKDSENPLPEFNFYAYVIVDDTMTYPFVFNSLENRLVRLFPLSVRAKQVKIVVMIPALNFSVKITGFSIFYTEDGVMHEISGSPNEHLPISSLGLYGRNYGRDYIVM